MVGQASLAHSDQSAQSVALLERDDPQTNNYPKQESCVLSIRQRLCPQAGATTVKGLVPIPQAVAHLAHVFANHKLFPNSDGVRINGKPEPKNAQGNQRTGGYTQAGFDKRSPAPVGLYQHHGQPERRSHRGNQGKRFVKQTQAPGQAHQQYLM